MFKKSCVALAAVLLVASGLWANGLNLNGFGARATAMGGAYVGLADDYTAVFWNPAGLALIQKPVFGLTGDFLLPTSHYTLDDFSMTTNNKMYPAGLLGYFRPVSDKVVVGVGVYTLSGLGQDWNNTGLEAALSPVPGSLFTPPVENYRWRSFIGSITIAPSVAIKLSDKFFFGATLNINYGFFKTDQWGEALVISQKPFFAVNFGQASMDVKGWGFGGTVGILAKPSDRISLGVTYRLQSKLKMSGTSSIENFPFLDPDLPDTSPAELEAISPMWLAGGVAVKPGKNLTLTFDLQWTNWTKLDTLTVKFTDPDWIDFGNEEQTLELLWKDKIQIRFGAEYTMGNFAIRGGYYYDPAPGPDETMNVLIPGFTYNSVAFGLGYKKGGLNLDFALEYLMGQDRTIEPAYNDAFPPELRNMPGLYQMNIVVPIFSVSYAF